jgi:hypothetical protein
LPIGEKPVEGLFQAFIERCVCVETELVASPGAVNASSGLAIGLRGIPTNLAFESDKLHNDFDEFSNGEFSIGAEIDRLVTVVKLRGEHDSFGCVIDKEKFTTR